MKVEQLDDRSIRVDGKTIEFEWKISKILSLPDRILVMFGVLEFAETDPDAGRNIFAYDLEGNALWRVEDARVMVGGRTVDKVSQGYTDLHRGDDGKIYAWVLDHRHVLDPETGKILEAAYMR